MTNLRVTLVQAELAWHDPETNRQRFEDRLAPLAGQTDLIVLPEMFTTGFTMSPQHIAEPAGGSSIEWLRVMAARTGAVITGSIATEEGGRYFNRLIWMRPDGRTSQYDKRHLFRMAHEHRHYVAGRERLIVELGGWKICPMVCYDLRFPVWSRNCIDTDGGYDLLLYVANWPSRRVHAWQTLLRARAIENVCYCIGVNRVGRDGNDIDYPGESAAVDYLGQAVAPTLEGELVQTVELDHAALRAFRSKFPVHLDADEFELRSGPLGG